MAEGIRLARPEDGAAVAAIYAPYVKETAISFEETPPTSTEMTDRINATLKHWPFIVFENNDKVVAYAYAGAHRAREAYRWSVDVTVYAEINCHRRGIGRALYLELLDRLARQGFHTAFAGIALPNDKSVGLHEALGFSHLGTYHEVGFKLGKWHDVGWWQRPLNHGLPARDPLPPSRVG